MSTKDPPGPRFLMDPPVEPPPAAPSTPVLVVPPRPVAPPSFAHDAEPPPRVTGPAPAADLPCRLFGVAVSDSDRFIAVAHDNGLVGLYQPVFAEQLGVVGPMILAAGHAGSVRAVAFEPPGARDYACLASGSTDHTIRTWHVGDETQNQELRHHDYSVMALAFDPAGTRLVSGSEDQTIAITRWSDGALEHRFDAHAGTVLAVACSPSGQRIASAGADGHAYLWSLGGERLARLDDDESDGGMAWGIQFLDEDRVVFAQGGSVVMWSTRSGSKVLHQFPEGFRSVRGLAVRADRAQIAFGFANQVVTLDLRDQRTRTRTVHMGEVNGLAYLGDGRLASAADDGALLLWGDGAQPALRLRAGSE